MIAVQNHKEPHLLLQFFLHDSNALLLIAVSLPMQKNTHTFEFKFGAMFRRLFTPIFLGFWRFLDMYYVIGRGTSFSGSLYFAILLLWHWNLDEF